MGVVLALLGCAIGFPLSAAKAAQAAIVWEADERGVIAASDHPRVAGWVEQSCREGDAPLTPGVGRALEQLTRACRGHHDLAPLRAAVQAGQMPVERGAEVASTYRRLKARIEVNCWDVVLAEHAGMGIFLACSIGMVGSVSVLLYFAVLMMFDMEMEDAPTNASLELGA